MMTIADKNNWVVSTIAAIIVHIGILFALAGQMNAGTSAKHKTEISILSIPSTSNAVPVNSTTIVRPVAVSDTLSQSSIDHDRLVSQAPDTTKAQAEKNFEKAVISQPVQLAALDAAGVSDNIVISNNPHPLTGTSDIKPVDTVKPVLAKPVRDTAEKLQEASATAATLARTPNEYIEDSGKDNVHARLNSSQNQQRAKIVPPAASVARSSATLNRIEAARPSPLKSEALPAARKMQAATGVKITPVAVKAPTPGAVAVQRQPAISTTTNSPIIRNRAQKTQTATVHARLETTRGQKTASTAIVASKPAFAPNFHRPNIAPVRMNTSNARSALPYARPIKIRPRMVVANQAARARPTTAAPVRAAIQTKAHRIDVKKPGFTFARSSPRATRPQAARPAVFAKSGKTKQTAVVPLTPQRRAIVSATQFNKPESAKKQFVAASKQKQALKPVRIAKIRIGPANMVAIIRPKTVLSPDKRTDDPRLARLTRPNQIRLKDQSNNARSNRLKFGKLLTYLKFQQEDNCFVALPTVSRDGQPELVGFGRTEQPWSRFLGNISKATKLAVPSRLARISAHQCQVTAFVHRSRAYPSFTVTLALQNNVIRTGEFLTGNLLNINGRYLSLLLIDDEGTAQLLNNYVTIGDDRSHFSIQLNNTGSPTSTSQLLLAIVTDQALESAKFSSAMPVTSLLEDMAYELIRRKLKADLAIAAFTFE